MAWGVVLHFNGDLLIHAETMLVQGPKAPLYYRCHRRQETRNCLARKGIGTLKQH